MSANDNTLTNRVVSHDLGLRAFLAESGPTAHFALETRSALLFPLNHPSTTDKMVSAHPTPDSNPTEINMVS